ncbi:MAG: hypothetical protein AAF532_16460 [Planctomycetota bacterium]
MSERCLWSLSELRQRLGCRTQDVYDLCDAGAPHVIWNKNKTRRQFLYTEANWQEFVKWREKYLRPAKRTVTAEKILKKHRKSRLNKHKQQKVAT